MSKSYTAIIEPKMLIWGRQYSNLSQEDAAKRIGVSREKLLEWEGGDSFPTVNQLHSIARVYHQPFAVFYLQNPPITPKFELKDFRRLPGDGLSDFSSDLIFEIHNVINRREITLELLKEMDETPNVFSLLLSIEDDVQIIGKMILGYLKIDTEKLYSLKDERMAFNFWRFAIENSGILVFQSSELELSETRGFSISSFPLPIIVVNRKDTYTGRCFSLIHELVHVSLRNSGVCDTDALISLPPETQQIEVFCNKVAAEVLMPSETFFVKYFEIIGAKPIAEITDREIQSVASIFGVSREAVVRKMVTLGIADENYYRNKRLQYLKQYEKRVTKKGFVHPVVDAISISGKPFSNLVLRAFDINRITSSDFSNYLGIKLKHLTYLNEKLGAQ